MWNKIKDSILVLIIAVTSPEIFSKCSFPMDWHHQVGIYLFGAAAIFWIWIPKHSDTDRIQQVFEAKNVHVDGKYPKLVKGGFND